jgi:CBS domain-containing protein
VCVSLGARHQDLTPITTSLVSHLLKSIKLIKPVEYYRKSFRDWNRIRTVERKSLVESASPSDLVSTIMSTRLVTVKSTDRVSKALQTMVRHKIGSIIAVERGKPVGILTERDISTKVAKGRNIRGMVVRSIMSTPLITVGPSAEVSQAVEQMVRNDIRRLPVVDGDKIVGMITERDILRYMITVSYAPNIPEDLRKLMETRAQAHALAH